MKKLKSSIFAKIGAWLLLCVFIISFMISAAVIMSSVNCYFYDIEKTETIEDVIANKGDIYDYPDRIPSFAQNYYSNPEFRNLVTFVFQNRYNAIWSCAAFGVLSILTLVFLMCAAGHVRGYEEKHLTWFDKIPLDLLTIGLVCAGVLPGVLIEEAEWLLYRVWECTRQEFILGASCLVIGLLGFVLLVCIFLVTLAARVKAGTWVKNTVVYRILSPIWRFIKQIFRWMGTALRSIPMVGKAALLGIAYFGALLIFSFAASIEWEPVFIVVFCVPLMVLGFCIFVLCAWQLKRLNMAAEQLASGNLTEKISTDKFFRSFKAHADNLNAISDGINTAVNERMRSERLKTELITNVSHDIKTPLTSIINYIDLMQHTEDEEQKKEYLEVLERQSVRLKKLMEDLIEASRASTGSIAVNLEPTVAGEIINQSLAEYNERILAAEIMPIVTAPEEPVELMADGKLLWRVMDNLLSNVCKYALHGTRMYIDLVEREDGMAVITVKNISGTRLNISADELMERFVRGDASRSTSGSGLGLNIAKSLCELMGGDFSITVDGDLFKAQVAIPLVPMEL